MDLYLAEKSLNAMIKTRLMMLSSILIMHIPFVGLFIAPIFLVFWGIKFYIALYKLGRAISWCDVAFIFYLFSEVISIFQVDFVKMFYVGLQLLAISIIVIAINGVIKKSTYVSVMYFGYVLILLKAVVAGINLYTMITGTTIYALSVTLLIISLVSFVWEVAYYKMAIFTFDSPYLYNNDTYYY